MVELKADINQSKTPDQYNDAVKRFALTTFNRIDGLDGYQDAVIRIENNTNRSVVVDNIGGDVTLLTDLMTSEEQAKFSQENITNSSIRFVYN